MTTSISNGTSPAMPARLAAGHGDEAFDVLAVVEAVAEQLEPRARKKFLSLMVFVAPELPRRIPSRAAGVHRVLACLVDNAIKYTEKGEVVVRAGVDAAGAPAARVRFDVCDTGIGLPADVAGWLARPEAVDPPPSLGALAEAYRLAADLGGTLAVTQTGSRGTTLSFSLPLAPAAEGASAALPAEPSGLRVLVVDDNATHREIVLRYLGFWGVRCDGAGSGDEALQGLHAACAEGDRYDMAILDLAMPGMDGFALAHAIRRDPALADTRLVLLTAFDERGQGELALREGFAAYLTKPVRHALLRSIVDAALAARSGGGPDA